MSIEGVILVGNFTYVKVLERIQVEPWNSYVYNIYIYTYFVQDLPRHRHSDPRLSVSFQSQTRWMAGEWKSWLKPTPCLSHLPPPPRLAGQRFTRRPFTVRCALGHPSANVAAKRPLLRTPFYSIFLYFRIIQFPTVMYIIIHVCVLVFLPLKCISIHILCVPT